MWVYTFTDPNLSVGEVRKESSTYRGILSMREAYFRKHGRRPTIHRFRLGTNGNQVSGCEFAGPMIGQGIRWVPCQPGFSNRILR